MSRNPDVKADRAADAASRVVPVPGVARSSSFAVLARSSSFAFIVLMALLFGGCRRDMQDQPKFIPLRESDFYADHRSARPIVEGTVARGLLADDELLETGKVNGQDATEFPFPVTQQVLARGQERFDIYCAPCHDRTGRGNGMIVRRGYRQPPSYHIDRLREAPVGHFFDVITNGFGAMPDYRAQVPVQDRWAIIAYIRALQLSEHATLDDVPAEERNKLAPGTGPAK